MHHRQTEISLDTLRAFHLCVIDDQHTREFFYLNFLHLVVKLRKVDFLQYNSWSSYTPIQGKFSMMNLLLEGMYVKLMIYDSSL